MCLSPSTSLSCTVGLGGHMCRQETAVTANMFIEIQKQQASSNKKNRQRSRRGKQKYLRPIHRKPGKQNRLNEPGIQTQVNQYDLAKEITSGQSNALQIWYAWMSLYIVAANSLNAKHLRVFRLLPMWRTSHAGVCSPTEPGSILHITEHGGDP